LRVRRVTIFVLAAIAMVTACASVSERSGSASSMPVPANATVSPLVTVRLSDGTYLHMTPLPLGRINGVIQGAVRFDSSGTRAVFVAAFPGTALGGDWRKANPTQAFLLDLGRRSLTQLTADGSASSARWLSATKVSVEGGVGSRSIAVPGNLCVGARPCRAFTSGIRTFRLDPTVDAGDADVTPRRLYRVAVVRRANDVYAVTQVGAQYLHASGAAPNGACVILGDYVAWVDRDPKSGFTISRLGPDAGTVPDFSASPYGSALAPILPLGRFVYQGAYRNGVAYFAFTHGVERIVAATRDLVSFSYPKLPSDPAFTVGDGLGAGGDGALYFASSEDGRLQYWRSGRYVTKQMLFPKGSGDVRPLFDALSALTSGGRDFPAVHPYQDALDAAMLEWRIYPVGDETGGAWLASYLGHGFIADASLRFHETEPAFPFAVLGRTDDGRLWGASPLTRTADGSAVIAATSQVWSSRDGRRWRREAQLDGDAGAIGLEHRIAWAALTRPWTGRPIIALARLDAAQPASALTGGSYAGEQLMFAGLASGFYLVWGATPGTRLNADEGPLSAFRIDPDALFDLDENGLNRYARQRLDPQSDPSLPPAEFIQGGGAFASPTLDEFARATSSRHLTLVSNVAVTGLDPRRVTMVSPAQARAIEIEYGERQFPSAWVIAGVHGITADVSRSFRDGPLHARGAQERWIRDASRVWRLRAVLSRWSY